jgi:16S rRNA (cytidine1402-2'-O)-methyltransferase
MTPAQASKGRLVVCPTPIGNLKDVTLRVIAALTDADLIACEDTRHTRPLLDRHGITTPALSFHEHNEAARASELTDRIAAGAIVALVSDAGTPLISDPGFQLVRSCIAAGLPLEVLPGPSSVITALVASGLPASTWRFLGFLPRRPGPELEALLAANDETLLAFESPRRLSRTLSLIASLDAERPLAVCRELTKIHEEVRRGSARELASHYTSSGPGGSALRGEIVLVIAPAPEPEPRLEEALEALTELIAAGSRTRPAASVVARLTRTRPNDLYRALNDPGRSASHPSDDAPPSPAAGGRPRRGQ